MAEQTLTPAETIELEYMRDLLSDTPTGGESDVAGLLDAATRCTTNGMAPLQAVTGLVENLAVRLNGARRESADLRVQCGQWEEKWKAAIDNYMNLQETVKYQESEYLKSHGGSWGACKYQGEAAILSQAGEEFNKAAWKLLAHFRGPEFSVSDTDQSDEAMVIRSFLLCSNEHRAAIASVAGAHP